MVGIEHIDELVQMSIKNVEADDPELLSAGRIKLIGESGDVKAMPLTNADIETAQVQKIITLYLSIHSGRWKAWLSRRSPI